jgi:molecular chaperone GrpE
MEEMIDRSEEMHAPEPPTFVVTDKRFWARKGGGDHSTTEEAVVSSPYPTYVEQLKAQLAEQEQKLRRSLQKLSTENEEFRKRVERDLQRQIALYKEKFLERLLPVVDNLERAIASAHSPENFTAFLEGIQLVRSQFLAQLKEEGVEQIEVLHQPFDPVTAEAVSLEVVEDKTKENVVLHEVEKGYCIHGKLLRPAKVIVGKASQEAPHDNNHGGEEEDTTQL